jgi:hypothetical protein
MSAVLFKRLNTDDRLLLTGLATINVTTGASTYLTASATVTTTVLDRTTQVAVTGETWPVTLSYITGTNGNFHGVLRDTLVVTEHQRLDVRVTIDNGTDQKRTIVLPCTVIVDRGE